MCTHLHLLLSDVTQLSSNSDCLATVSDDYALVQMAQSLPLSMLGVGLRLDPSPFPRRRPVIDLLVSH